MLRERNGDGEKLGLQIGIWFWWADPTYYWPVSLCLRVCVCLFIYWLYVHTKLQECGVFLVWWLFLVSKELCNISFFISLIIETWLILCSRLLIFETWFFFMALLYVFYALLVLQNTIWILHCLFLAIFSTPSIFYCVCTFLFGGILLCKELKLCLLISGAKIMWNIVELPPDEASAWT